MKANKQFSCRSYKPKMKQVAYSLCANDYKNSKTILFGFKGSLYHETWNSKKWKKNLLAQVTNVRIYITYNQRTGSSTQKATHMAVYNDQHLKHREYTHAQVTRKLIYISAEIDETMNENKNDILSSPNTEI